MYIFGRFEKPKNRLYLKSNLKITTTFNVISKNYSSNFKYKNSKDSKMSKRISFIAWKKLHVEWVTPVTKDIE